MEFQKYIDNLTNQLQLVNADIVEKQEELDKLKEFRSRIKGGMEVVKQIQTDLAEESTPLPLQQEIQQSIQELTQGRHGSDLDAL
jgi:hypothetical protein